jgi:DNA-binding transcriptional regulator GbsR (MarR family)
MKTGSSIPSWTASRSKFIEAGGHATQSFGLGRILGQIYALLYLSPAPLCLDEIVVELGVSKASVSTTIRQLERWAAVKRVWVKGDRKDYYEVEEDFRTILRQGLLAMMVKKIDTAGVQLNQVEGSLREIRTGENGQKTGDLEVVVRRLKRARSFQSKFHTLLSNPLLERLL